MKANRMSGMIPSLKSLIQMNMRVTKSKEIIKRGWGMVILLLDGDMVNYRESRVTSEDMSEFR